MARRLVGTEPSVPQHAATKGYVDFAVGGLAVGSLNGITPLGTSIATSSTAEAVRLLIGAGTSSVLTLADLGVTVTSTEINRLSGVTANVQSQLGDKEPAIGAGTVAQYWRGDKSWAALDRAAVGLGNVDNTSDATKNAAPGALTNKVIDASQNTLSNIAPSSVSGLTAALSGKEPAVAAGTTSQYYRGDKTWQTLEWTAISGRPSLSDLPQSSITGLVDALADRELIANKGQPNGYAPLGPGTKISAQYLPDSWLATTVSDAAALASSPRFHYVYLLAAGAAPTLPTAVANSSRYTLKNIHSADVTIGTASSQTIEGEVGFVLSPGASVDLVSDGANWRII